MNNLDQRLAQELARRKQDSLAKQKKIEKTIAECSEIRDLKQKIHQAYVNKERAAQIAEKQTRSLQQIVQ